MTASIPAEAALALADGALIGAWRFTADGRTDVLDASEVAAALGGVDGVLWLHFNLANARATDYLAAAPWLPEPVRAHFSDRQPVPVAAGCADGLQVTLPDIAYDADEDLAERTTIWAWANERLAVTARLHPASTIDALRQAVRDGERFELGVDVVVRLYELRSERLRRVVDQLAERIAEAEDQVFDARMTAQREALGRIRLVGGRVRRHVAADRLVIDRLLERPPPVLAQPCLARLTANAADLVYLHDEIAEAIERTHLLQGELASRVAEDTNRRMAVLTTVSVVLMPMTVATGLWGMNTGGLPGAENDWGFAWVTLLVLAAGGLTLWLLRRFRLL